MQPEELKTALKELREEIGDDLKAGQAETHRRLDEVNAHLRLLNGRVGTSEVNRAADDVRIRNLERETFHRRRADRDAPAARVPVKPADGRAISERDVHMVAIGAGGLTAIVGFFWKLLPAIAKALTP